MSQAIPPSEMTSPSALQALRRSASLTSLVAVLGAGLVVLGPASWGASSDAGKGLIAKDDPFLNGPLVWPVRKPQPAAANPTPEANVLELQDWEDTARFRKVTGGKVPGPSVAPLPVPLPGQHRKRVGGAVGGERSPIH